MRSSLIIDLSHPIGRFTYPGLPPPELRTVVTRAETAARLAPGVSFEIESLSLVGNTGTYIDSPFHYHAGWSQHWGTPRYTELDCPHLAADAVGALIDAGVAVVGIDSLNIDCPSDEERPAHHGLLGAGIPVIEHLTNLASVPDGARLTALPAPVRGMASFPVRAIAVCQ
jgi:kynurenine formamidase